MKKKILISTIIFSILLSPIAFAEDNKARTGGAGTFNACKHVVSGNTAVCSGDSKDATNIAKNIISILLWVVGIAAVIVIIYAGTTFIISAGNPSKISQAKTMLTYAVVGLAVAILAYAIVNFVINASSGKGVDGGSSSGSSGSSGESNNSGDSNSSSSNSKPSTKPNNSSGSNNAGSQSKNRNGENGSGQNSSGSNRSNNN